jgi:hypothetical protein
LTRSFYADLISQETELKKEEEMRVLATIMAIMLLATTVVFAQETDSIPLKIKGETFLLKKNARYDDVKAEIGKIMKQKKPSIFSKERIQYDFQAVAGQASMTLLFDFDKTGNLSGVIINAYMKEQNPTAQALKSWLESKYGAGKKVGSAFKWSVGGYECLFEEGGDGDDSSYGFTISKMK